jgi:threonine dehydrogenase-like Zn-dependent dehydrogenase
VVVCSTIACGNCSYCRAGYFSQCDHANPGGRRAGTAFFGGLAATGPYDGLQAEKARIPFAQVGLVRVPDAVSDDQAILISDIFPTGYFAADNADIDEGHIVAVFGCGPVGLTAIIGARLMGAGRIIAIDHQPDRLLMAQRQGAEIVNFDDEDPVEAILSMTGGIGVDRAIDAVGVDAEPPHEHPAQDSREGREGHAYRPGGAPSRVLEWATDALAKAGTLSIVGVYPPDFSDFPIGKAMGKNLVLRMGNCNHRRYVPHLLDLVASGVFDPMDILTEIEPAQSAVASYALFDQRKPGWLKVELKPQEAIHVSNV